MKRTITYSLSILTLFLLTGCFQTQMETFNYCVSACKEIPPSETAPEITGQELEQGWYWGQLDQKKPGTPDDWLHFQEGSRSAGWFAPTNGSQNCDCNSKK